MEPGARGPPLTADGRPICEYWYDGRGCRHHPCWGGRCTAEHPQNFLALNMCKKYDRGSCDRVDCARFHENAPGYVHRMNKLAEQVDMDGSARVRSPSPRGRFSRASSVPRSFPPPPPPIFGMQIPFPATPDPLDRARALIDLARLNRVLTDVPDLELHALRATDKDLDKALMDLEDGGEDFESIHNGSHPLTVFFQNTKDMTGQQRLLRFVCEARRAPRGIKTKDKQASSSKCTTAKAPPPLPKARPATSSTKPPATAVKEENVDDEPALLRAMNKLEPMIKTAWPRQQQLTGFRTAGSCPSQGHRGRGFQELAQPAPDTKPLHRCFPRWTTTPRWTSRSELCAWQAQWCRQWTTTSTRWPDPSRSQRWTNSGQPSTTCRRTPSPSSQAHSWHNHALFRDQVQ